MADFTRNVVTDVGLNLFAKADAGIVTVKFTRIVTSSHNYDDTADLKTLTTIEDIQQTKVPDAVTAETDPDTGGNIVYARALIPNTDVTTGYDLYAYGLFADNPDNPGVVEDEILVMISATAIGTAPLSIPAYTNNNGLAVQPKFVIALTTADNIELNINPAGSVTQEDLENLRKLVIGSNFPNKVWINNQSDVTLANGSVNFPYKSINAAIAANSGTSNVEFIIAAGLYNESLTITNQHYWLFSGIGAIGGQLVTITGDIDITDTSDHIGIDSINFTGEFTSNSTSGFIYTDNCHYASFTTGTASAGQLVLDYCSFDNDIQIYGTPSIIFRLTDFRNSGILYMRNSGQEIELNSCFNAAVVHQAGRLFVTGDTQFKKYATGYAINSTATGANNPLLLFNGTTAQPDGSFASINQTASDGYYVIGSFIHSPVMGFDTFAGIRVKVGEQISDIIDNNTYTSISPVSGYLKETLQLFDAQVSSNNTTLNQILTNTNTILTRVNTINTNVNTLLNKDYGAVRQVVRVSPSSTSASTFNVNFVNVAKVSWVAVPLAFNTVRTFARDFGTAVEGEGFAPTVLGISSTNVTVSAGYTTYNGIIRNVGGTIIFTEYY